MDFCHFPWICGEIWGKIQQIHGKWQKIHVFSVYLEKYCANPPKSKNKLVLRDKTQLLAKMDFRKTDFKARKNGKMSIFKTPKSPFWHFFVTCGNVLPPSKIGSCTPQKQPLCEKLRFFFHNLSAGKNGWCPTRRTFSKS